MRERPSPLPCIAEEIISSRSNCIRPSSDGIRNSSLYSKINIDLGPNETSTAPPEKAARQEELTRFAKGVGEHTIFTGCNLALSTCLSYGGVAIGESGIINWFDKGLYDPKTAIVLGILFASNLATTLINSFQGLRRVSKGKGSHAAVQASGKIPELFELILPKQMTMSKNLLNSTSQFLNKVSTTAVVSLSLFNSFATISVLRAIQTIHKEHPVSAYGGSLMGGVLSGLITAGVYIGLNRNDKKTEKEQIQNTDQQRITP